MNTYIIYQGPYMYDRGDTMTEFKGTWRYLLYKLHNVDPEDSEWADDMSEEGLKELFESINGDGMSYYMVWHVEGHKVVIGGDND